MKNKKLLALSCFLLASLVVGFTSIIYQQNTYKKENADINYSIVMNAETTNNWSFLNNVKDGYIESTRHTFRYTEFEFQNALENNNNLQLIASQGLIYNTQADGVNNFAITGLQSIRIKYSSSTSLMMYFGENENPTTNELVIASDVLLDISSYAQYKYVAIKTGSNYATINEIVLNYSCYDSVIENPNYSLEVNSIRSEYKVGEVINPTSDFEVFLKSNNIVQTKLNYDQTGANGWYFSYFLDSNADEYDFSNPFNLSGLYLFEISYQKDGNVIEYSDGELNVYDETIEKQSPLYTYQNYSQNCVYNTPAMPSVGSPKALIVPIWLTDSSEYLSISKKQQVRQDIETAYLGSKEETGWHSVKTYYQEDSYGKLNLEGVVTDWYTSTYSSSINGDQTVELVKEVANWYKNQVSLDVYKSFDTNSDGYLDALILIYAASNYSNGGGNGNDNLWAYCFWVQNKELKDIDNPGPNTFFWASYDFMYEDTSHCTIDAHTYIHEMGHVLGLDDYYDYSYYGNQPAGGFSMQDYNVGGHDPFSKMALGWVEPYAPTSNSIITINRFQETGDLIVLSPDFIGSPFDEYLILELYSPTGLNEFDSLYKYQNAYPQGPSDVGIRLWHVDARMRGTYVSGNQLYFDGSKYYNEFDLNSSPYGFALSMSNTTYASSADEGYVAIFTSDYNYDLLALIRNNKANDINMEKILSNDCLFKQGDTFSMSEYSSSFPNIGKLNSGLDLGFSFEITSLNELSATIKITQVL